MMRQYQQGKHSRTERLFTPIRCRSYGCTKYTNMSHGLCAHCVDNIRNKEKWAKSVLGKQKYKGRISKRG